MVRILQVVRRMNYGGLETLLMNIYRNIDKTKMQFDFIVDEEGKYDKEIEKMGGRIFYIKYITDVGVKKYENSLRNFFREHKEYKIVHSHLDQVSGIVMKAAALEDVPIRISHSHNTKNSNNFIVKIYKKYLQKMIIKYGNNFFACSQNAGKWLFGKKSKECYVLNNGINTDVFEFSKKDREEIRNSLNISDEECVWGHVGRIVKTKNQEFLIKVFYEYQKEHKNSKLILIGRGRLRTKLEEECEKLNIKDKVVFVGATNEPEKYYSAFDIMVFPSLHEGISLVMIEAQISGLPILASDRIDKKTDVTNTLEYMGLEESPSKWAKRVEGMNLNRKLENKEKVIKSGYDIRQVANNLFEKYNELLEGINE